MTLKSIGSATEKRQKNKHGLRKEKQDINLILRSNAEKLCDLRDVQGVEKSDNFMRIMLIILGLCLLNGYVRFVMEYSIENHEYRVWALTFRRVEP